jgi:hypothetical protein
MNDTNLTSKVSGLNVYGTFEKPSVSALYFFRYHYIPVTLGGLLVLVYIPGVISSSRSNHNDFWKMSLSITIISLLSNALFSYSNNMQFIQWPFVIQCTGCFLFLSLFSVMPFLPSDLEQNVTDPVTFTFQVQFIFWAFSVKLTQKTSTYFRYTMFF